MLFEFYNYKIIFVPVLLKYFHFFTINKSFKQINCSQHIRITFLPTDLFLRAIVCSPRGFKVSGSENVWPIFGAKGRVRHHRGGGQSQERQPRRDRGGENAQRRPETTEV